MNEEEFIEFSRLIGKLKETKRTGWIKDAKLKTCESVADHCFRTTVLAMVLSDIKSLDTEKIMRMSLIHDLEEAVTGDIIRSEKEKMDPDERERMYMNALEKVFSNFPQELKEKYICLWKEVEECKSKEAMFVNSMDRVDQGIQALEYWDKDPTNKILKLFMDDNDFNIRTPETEKIIKKLEILRDKHA